MKDTHLTLRLPRELARALARWAKDLGLPKSEVAREAVARYLAPAPAGRMLTAAELAKAWGSVPRLSPADAEGLGADIAASRRGLPAPRDPWE